MTSKNADLEQVFQSIEQGNTLHDEKKYWQAATAYADARRQLLQLGGDINDNESNHDDANDDAEAARIRQLYQQQARDYLHKARETLLQALSAEDEADRKLPLSDPTHVEQLVAKKRQENGKDDDDDDSCLERLRLFAWLYSSEEALVVAATSTNTSAEAPPVEEQQSSLEDRLRALNASLPQGVKTADERMRDLNKGLKHLGVSVPSQSTTTTTKPQELFEANAKSDIEQVEDIIAQAKDEVLMEQVHPSSATTVTSSGSSGVIATSSIEGNGVKSSNAGAGLSDAADKLMDSMIDAVEESKKLNPAVDSDKDDDDNESSKSDADPAGSNPFSSSDLAFFQDRVNEAQASLAELNAMLDIDNDDDADILFDPDTAKHSLDSALRYLQQVQKKWKEAKKAN